MERSLIVESRYARNYIPKFQAEFGVAEEEVDGPRVGPLKRLGNHALRSRPVTFTLALPILIPLKYPTPGVFPMGGINIDNKLTW